jgi:hypothetical protein
VIRSVDGNQTSHGGGHVLAVARLTLQLLLPFLEAGRAIYADYAPSW